MRLSAALAAFLAFTAHAADPLPRATPESVGVSSKRLERLDAAIRADVEKGRIPGAVLAIARDGKLVYLKAFGFLDKARAIPMRTDAIFAVASMTKPIVAAGALILQEENRMHLNEPVALYVPELDALQVIAEGPESSKAPFKTVAPRRKPTVHDLLRHTAGMTYGNRGNTELYKAWPGSGIRAAEEMTGPQFLEKIASLPLHYHPGTTWNYSLSFDVLGLVMERVTGAPLGDFLASRIFEPLGMEDTTFILPKEKYARLALPLPIDPNTGKPPATYDPRRPARFQCGGGCLVTTAEDYVRFYQMLLDKGRSGSTRVMSRKSIEHMTSNQLGPEVNVDALRTYPNINGYGFGLGVAVRLGTGVAGVMGSPGDFHWHGAAGSNAWADPHERLVVVYLAQAVGPVRFEYRRIINALVLQALE